MSTDDRTEDRDEAPLDEDPQTARVIVEVRRRHKEVFERLADL